MKKKPPYKRILLKLSGEALIGDQIFGISGDAAKKIAQGIRDFCEHDIEVGIVIGAGNIFRGIQGAKLGISRIPADHMGMLATIINSLALQQALADCGIEAIIMSAINCEPIVDPFNWKKAIHHLERKRVLIFAGGTGSPYFTTDTAAALRASEIQAELLLKATKVNGIYSKDPKKYPDAIRYETLSYAEVLAQNLCVMDATSVALCRASQIPILVFDMWATPKLTEVLHNPKFGTLVKD